MPRFILDGKDITGDLPAEPGLPQVFGYVDAISAGQQLFLKELSVDGQVWQPSELNQEEWTPEKLASVAEVQITTETAGNLACRTVEGLLNYLSNLPPHIMTLVDEFRRGDESKAYANHKEFMENLSHVFELLGPLQSLGKFSLADIEVEGRPSTEWLQEFGEITQEMVECLEEANSFMVSDLLEFEIIPQVGILEKLLQAILPYLQQN